MGIFNHTAENKNIKGKDGSGFKLTNDENYDLENKTLVNIATPTDNKDSANKSYVDNEISNKKPIIGTYAEESGSISAGNYEWSFGNGTENQATYGYCIPVSGRIKYGSIAASANGSEPGAEIRVGIVINGDDENSDYVLVNPMNQFSSFIQFQTPLEVNAGDRINFISKTNNSAVTHAIVCLLIEIDA